MALHGTAGPTGSQCCRLELPNVLQSTTPRLGALPPQFGQGARTERVRPAAGQPLGDGDGLAEDDGEGFPDGLALPASTSALRTRSRAAPWAFA